MRKLVKNVAEVAMRKYNLCCDAQLCRFDNLYGNLQINEVIAKFEKQICGRENIYMHKNRRSQEENQPFEDFLSELQTMLKKTGYKEFCSTETSYRDRVLPGRIIAGLYSDEMRH